MSFPEAPAEGTQPQASANEALVLSNVVREVVVLSDSSDDFF